MKENVNVCEVANDLVVGARQKEYGHPVDDFSRTAGGLTSYGFSFNGSAIEPEHIPIIMLLVKISRMVQSKECWHRDSAIDICGYMRTGEMVNQKKYGEKIKETQDF